MKDHEAKAEAIFQKATTMPSPEARQAYVMGACEGNEALRERVNQLLESFTEAEEVRFLRTGPRPELPADQLRGLPLSEGPGTTIGHYKLLQQIGEGGFGVVYMAEQKEPVKRRVALKIIKLGMDTKQVVARFEAERQALALMEHPNIARVLDAGATETGRPYFVMELVKGVPITKFCDENNLTLPERLALFIPVCHAVQHAHQKGVIHRDLKPSNILVTLHDDRPVPKVIDFGIAKATQQELTTKTLFTQFQHFIGTPAYMSPEQAQLSGLDIDTRSDVYALGVLLYELLTGQTPFDAQELLSGGYDEIRRRIREEEPPKPSTRWSTLQADQRSSVARNRKAEPEKLGSFLRGDLDWIVMKALEKDRTRRYETANGLAQDIERHLASEPVLAAAPSAIYRSRKFARRNRGVLAVAAAFAGMLLGGTMVAGWLAARATEAAEQARLAQQAETEQRKLAQASEAKAAESLVQAEDQRQQTEQALQQMQVQRAETLLQGGHTSWGLAYLARILRDHPNHQVAANRLISALLQRTYALQPYDPLEHDGPVQYAEFSPDGRWVVTASWDKRAQLWDAATGKPVGEPMLHENRVWQACFSPDSRRVVTASEDGTARIWDGAAGTPVSEPLVHEGNVHLAEFSADGTRVLTASNDKTARIWDGLTGRAVTGPLRHEDGIEHAHFSPDGTRVVTACGDRSARVWDAATGTLVGDPFQHEAAVVSAYFSPDGGRIVTAAQDRTVRVWDTATGQPLTHPLKHADPLRNAVFSDDGLRLLTVTYKAVQIWDARVGQRLLDIPNHEGLYVYAARFSPDGLRLAISSGKTARIWDAVTGEALTEPCWHQNNVTAVNFSPDGRRIVTASWDKRARVWDVQSGRALSTRLPHRDDVMALDFSPDGQLLATASSDKTARVWNVLTGQPVTPPLRHEGAVASVQFSPDGRRVVTAGWDNTARLWDAATGQPLLEPIKHEDGIPVVRFSPDGRKIVTASLDHTARIWDADDGKPLTPPLRHDERVYAASFSPDGHRVVTSSQDKTARIWDAHTGEPVAERLQHEDWVSTAAFSPDSQRVVTASTRFVQVWDANTGKPVTGPLPHEGHVKSVQFSPDGRRVASASFDTTVLVWDATTGQIQTEPLRHNERAVQARFSRDGHRLVTGSMDLTARVWDSQTGLPLTEPLWHLDGVEQVLFSPDGQCVATACYDDAARIWMIPYLSGTVPSWFPDWAETVAGRRMTAHSIIQEKPADEGLEVRSQINRRTDAEAATRIAQWFFADRSTRMIAPFASISVPQYVEQCVQENTLTSLREAILLSPTNDIAYARMAELLAAQDSAEHPEKETEAAFYRRLAEKLRSAQSH